ncbi:MAG TPA: molybdopterin-dependent oxidoreductase [Thermoleophilaceae bacterium]|nr:molybdopterin-dependent oxidoreductase [Thermoleophilaceae bacterium]
MSLPPGQRALDTFPRFGTHLAYPPPRVLPDHEIAVGGAVAEPFSLPLAALGELPRKEMTADFHCVAGWSATGLRWEGVPFERFFALVIEPALSPGAPITHVTFQGRDGYRSTACLEDVLAQDVLIAEHLDGRPLDGDHGAPVRLVSPRQYGFISTKHLCRLEVHTAEPATRHHRNALNNLGLRLVEPHVRARVWEEERNGYLPAWAVRVPYRMLIPPIRALAARGGRGER